MNRITVFVLCALFAAAVCAAAQNEPVKSSAKTAAEDEGGQQPAAEESKAYIKVGAIEKIGGSKYIMRKIDARYEFFLNGSAKLFLREEGTSDDMREKEYIVVKGPSNKKVILAKAIYIFTDRSDYDGFTDKNDVNTDASQAAASGTLQGSVRQKDPLIMMLSDGKEYTVSYDDDTYIVMTKQCDRSELKPGDRVKLYFDKLYSIRYDNYPVKVIIDRVKSGY